MLLLGFVLSDDVESGDVTSICWCGVVSLGVSVLSTNGVSLENFVFLFRSNMVVLFLISSFVLGREWLMRVIVFYYCCFSPS